MVKIRGKEYKDDISLVELCADLKKRDEFEEWAKEMKVKPKPKTAQELLDEE